MNTNTHINQAPTNPAPGKVTELLQRWTAGDKHSLERLTPLVYKQLYRQAKLALNGEKRHHPLQTTALIGEVYVQLLSSHDIHFDNRAQFFGFAGKLMHRILVRYARERCSQKRGGGCAPIPYTDFVALSHGGRMNFEELLALEELLLQIEQLDERQHQIIELRFFAGMNNNEIATLPEPVGAHRSQGVVYGETVAGPHVA